MNPRPVILDLSCKSVLGALQLERGITLLPLGVVTAASSCYQGGGAFPAWLEDLIVFRQHGKQSLATSRFFCLDFATWSRSELSPFIGIRCVYFCFMFRVLRKLCVVLETHLVSGTSSPEENGTIQKTLRKAMKV